MCPDDPFDDGVSNLVLNSLVVSTADEKLVLNRGWKGGHNPTETIMDFGLCKSAVLCYKQGSVLFHSEMISKNSH